MLMLCMAECSVKKKKKKKELDGVNKPTGTATVEFPTSVLLKQKRKTSQIFCTKQEFLFV